MLIPISSGFAGATVSFTVGDVVDSQVDPDFSIAGVSFFNDGTYTGTGNISGFSGNWIAPTSAAGNDYEIRMTVNSGTTPSGSATGSWLGLGTSRIWTLSQSGVGSLTANVTVEIRRASSGSVLSDGGGAFDFSVTVSI